MPVSSPNAKPTRILFDPIFSLRASPTPYIGVTRRLPPPCTVEELPEFHFVAISHNQCVRISLPSRTLVVAHDSHPNSYDHLDYPTVDSIHKLRGSLVHYIVPLGPFVRLSIYLRLLICMWLNTGNKSWFESCNIPSSQITELDWWQEASFELPSAPSPVKFVCTPAQHTSGKHFLRNFE
jgi:N-acyl-phosphatidylethanolamine-hydrolysing phospholipase D